MYNMSGRWDNHKNSRSNYQESTISMPKTDLHKLILASVLGGMFAAIGLVSLAFGYGIIHCN